MVEQTTAAAAILKREAEALAKLVGRYRTGAPGASPALEAQRARLRVAF